MSINRAVYPGGSNPPLTPHVLWGGLMITIETRVTYECPKCLMIFSLKFTPKSAIDVISIAQGANRLRRCTICARYMRIKKAVFKVTKAKDEYGSPTSGTWSCPAHTVLTYYPLVIKAATEGTPLPIVTGKLMRHRYTKIASMRYPWKCPICGQPMIYGESKGA